MIETVIPRTGNGKSVGAWAKVLSDEDEKAKDGYGFNGRFVRRGSPLDLPVGTVLLECAGANSPTGDKKYLLWELIEDGNWIEIVEANGPAWALEVRDEAIEALGTQEKP